eukprot:7996448-Ditylum_brightwellii.AAC.1
MVDAWAELKDYMKLEFKSMFLSVETQITAMVKRVQGTGTPPFQSQQMPTSSDQELKQQQASITPEHQVGMPPMYPPYPSNPFNTQPMQMDSQMQQYWANCKHKCGMAPIYEHMPHQ